MASVQHAPRAAGKLGTFAGVFTPSILTILGIILFLRLGYVVGSSGLQAAFLIIVLANAISVLTSFSIAAIATNIKVKGGGDYYVISRTLGVGFGGAIGLVLFFAQAISVGFYAVGFGEAAAALLGLGSFAPQAIAATAVAALFVLAWLGADWASRFQYVVMGLIFAALGSFLIGAADAFGPAQAAANWARPENALPFWAAFAIFFPAVTGFTQGVSMSGDLADPARSIPRGTFMAVGLSIVVYLGVAILMAGSEPLGELSADPAAMNRIAVFAPLIDAGVIAATLSSALASFLGAPRILQALAADDVFPALGPFAKGEGETNNPRRGVMFCGLVALAVVALGNLNLIASVVSMFFLVSYGLLNYATYYEARSKNPSFRPSFRFYDARLSLLGGLGCLGAILAIDWKAGLAAAAIVFGIHQYLSRSGAAARWSDSRRSHHLREARDHLLAAAKETVHPRDWRPQILLFSADAERRARLLDFSDWIGGDTGLVTAVHILEGGGPDALERRTERFAALEEELKSAGSKAFPLVVAAPELDPAIAAVVQAVGVGPLKVNTVLANWIEGVPAVIGDAAVGRYGRNLRTAFRLGCNVLVLDADSNEWARLAAVPPKDRRIDVWWHESKTGELMLLLVHLMTRHKEWSEARLRVLLPIDADKPDADQLDAVTAFLKDVRIDAEAVAVPDADLEAVVAQSADAQVVFLPFAIHAGRFYDLFGEDVVALLPRLPIVAMALAAQDVDLDADPDRVEESDPDGQEGPPAAAAWPTQPQARSDGD